MVCSAVVKDPHLGEGDVYYGDGGPEEVYGVDGAFGVMLEVPAEDCQGSFLRACVVGEYGVVRGREEKLQVVPQACVHVGGHVRLVEHPAWACVAGPLCGLEADGGNSADPASGCGSCSEGGGRCVWRRPLSPRPLWRPHSGAMPPGCREWVWRWASLRVLPMPW